MNNSVLFIDTIFTLDKSNGIFNVPATFLLLLDVRNRNFQPLLECLQHLSMEKNSVSKKVLKIDQVHFPITLPKKEVTKVRANMDSKTLSLMKPSTFTC